MKLKHFLTGRKFMTNFDNIKKQRHYYANKCLCTQSYGFSSHHVWMWELDSDVSWGLKNWSFWTAVLEKTLESPLDCKEFKSVHSKGDQSWVFIWSTDDKAETSIHWPHHVKILLIGKDSDVGTDWRQEEKGTTEDEMAGWHHWLVGWMWVNYGSWWWTGSPGILWFMRFQKVGPDWATVLNWSVWSSGCH